MWERKRLLSQIKKGVDNVLGYPPKEKAAIKRWKALQESGQYGDGVCCLVCVQPIYKESKIPIFNLMKPPAWSIAKGCEGFDEEGNEIEGVRCVLQTVEE